MNAKKLMKLFCMHAWTAVCGEGDLAGYFGARGSK